MTHTSYHWRALLTLALGAMLLAACGSEPPTPTDLDPTPSPATTAKPTDADGPAPATTSDPVHTPGQIPDNTLNDGNDDADDDDAADTANAANLPVDDEAFQALLSEVEALYEQARFDEARLKLMQERAAHRAHPEYPTLVAMGRRLREAITAFARVQPAIELLASPNPNDQAIARRSFLTAGEVGRVVLRQKLREESLPVAVAAANLLSQLRDERGFDLAARRLASTEPGEHADELHEIVARGLQHISHQAMRMLYQRMQNLEPDQQGPPAALLARGLHQQELADADKTNQTLGSEDAFTRIREILDHAMRHHQHALLADHHDVAIAFDVFIPGLRARYYHGVEYNELHIERLDTTIMIGNRDAFPTRPEHISARWTGYLLVHEPGTYRFQIRGDDDFELFINEQSVLRGSVTTNSGEIDLEPGMHPLKITFRQGGGAAYIQFQWQPPGAEELTPVDDNHLRTTGWEGMMVPTPHADDDADD